jgi:quinol monooxygenase YgiN
MILIVAKNPVRPEYADDWPSLMEEFTSATRAEPGNICFDWYRSVDEPNVYVLVEAFEDGTAGEAHMNSDHFKAAMDRLSQLLADVPEIVNVEVTGGWARMAEVKVDVSGTSSRDSRAARAVRER